MTRSRTVWRGLLSSCLVLAVILAAALTIGQQSGAAQVSIDCEAIPAPAAAAATPAVDAATPAPAAAFPEEGGELMIFAAASLTDVFTEIANDITAAHPEISIEFNFAGSQVLVTQLEQGAEADLFASANLPQMNAAIDAGVIDEEPSIFAQNELVIIVPGDNPADLESPADLGKPGILLDVAQEAVPVGLYTRQAVCLMAADPETYGEDFADRVAANIVSEEENVRAVVTKVALGEADAGVVYATDVTADVADRVEVIPIPAEVNVIADYPVAIVTGGDAALAQAFIDYLLGPEGQVTLTEFGFRPRP